MRNDTEKTFTTGNTVSPYKCLALTTCQWLRSAARSLSPQELQKRKTKEGERKRRDKA